MVFPLYDEAEKEWLEWAPRIAVVPEKTEPEMIESEETHSLQ
jgi:hypothetical protein